MSQTKYLIRSLRDKIAEDATKHRSELLILARYIAMRFGFKLVIAKDTDAILSRRDSKYKQVYKLSHNDTIWRDRFLQKALMLRTKDPDRYHYRLHQQRVEN